MSRHDLEREVCETSADKLVGYAKQHLHIIIIKIWLAQE